MTRLCWSILSAALWSLSILPVNHGFVAPPSLLPTNPRIANGGDLLLLVQQYQQKTATTDSTTRRGTTLVRGPVQLARIMSNTSSSRSFTSGKRILRLALLYSEKSLGGGGGSIDGSSDNSGGVQTLAYVLTSLAYALIIFLMPDKTHTVQLERKLAGACGFGLAAALSNILAVASARNRLALGVGVDSYKKLNLGLIAFCAVGLFAMPGESAFTPLTIPATLLAGFMSIVRVMGAVTAYLGWRIGVQKGSSVMSELVAGVQTTKESLHLEKSHKGWFYKYSTVFVAFGVLTNILLIGRSKLDFDISLELSAIARLILVASTLLTLKDANDREQLAGKTFVQMNFMLAAWAFIGTTYSNTLVRMYEFT